jgi:hypothetical protein
MESGLRSGAAAIMVPSLSNTAIRSTLSNTIETPDHVAVSRDVRMTAVIGSAYGAVQFPKSPPPAQRKEHDRALFLVTFKHLLRGRGKKSTF